MTNTLQFALVLMVSLISLTSEAAVLFSTDYEGSGPRYGFEGVYPSSDGQYRIERAPGAGWNGTTGARIIERAGAQQYNLGWYQAPMHSWSAGDVLYARFRIKFDSNWRWDGDGSMQNKMLDIGVGGNGESRMILHQEREHTTTPCGLTSVSSAWGAFSMKKGITSTCTPPVPITINHWYHVQLAIRAKRSSNDGYFKLWVNNNDISNPSSQRNNVDIAATYWNDSWSFGGFITDAPIRDQGWVVDDFELADSFDPNWAPAGATLPLPNGTANSGLPFFSGFESGDFSVWNGGATGGLQVVGQGCQDGTFCARAALTQGTHSDNYANFHFGDFWNIGGSKVEEVYLRVFSKFDQGYVWPNDSQKIAIINLTDGVSSQRRYQVYVYVDSNGEYAADHSNISTWQFFALPLNQGVRADVRVGQWDELKLHVRLNTPGVSDGVVRLWVNGELKLAYDNVNIREGTDYGMGRLIMSSYATDSSGSDGTQWWDALSLTEQDPGSNGIPLLAPSGFRVLE